jgi:signal transduction histidine kinase
MYHQEDQRPRVSITAEREDGDRWLISVADNGIGIEPRYADLIFGIFKRLHPERRYSGTGMGLALCRKVIEYHGGTIAAESAPGEGAIFRFTLKAT